MTEKERIEKTYAKIRAKHPDVVNQAELDALAVQADKRTTLLQAFAWLAGGIVSFIIFILMLDSSYDSVRLIFMMMAGSGVFEFFRTLGKYGKIQKRYNPVSDVRFDGFLTTELILKNCKRELSKSQGRFLIIKETLQDKNDKLDTGYDNETHHSYWLHFQTEAGERTLKVKRGVYLDAVLGTEYYLVVTTDALGSVLEIADAYQATNWHLAEDVMAYCRGDVRPAVPQAAVQPPVPKSVRVTMPILAIVFAVVGGIVPIILSVPLLTAAMVLSIVSLKRVKTKLTIASLVVAIISTVLLVLTILGYAFGII